MYGRSWQHTKSYNMTRKKSKWFGNRHQTHNIFLRMYASLSHSLAYGVWNRKLVVKEVQESFFIFRAIVLAKGSLSVLLSVENIVITSLLIVDGKKLLMLMDFKK